MRIVAGEFRGRRLHAPTGRAIRPTADRVREAIFSIIAAHVPDADVLDLYAGTGALGLEALSRGASRVVFVDRSPEAVRLIRTNIEICAIQRDRVEVVQGPVAQVIGRLVKRGDLFHLIFMDPPYAKGYIEKTLTLVEEAAHPTALVVAEHRAGDALPDRRGQWLKTRERRYGDTAVSFFEREFPR